MKPFTSEQKLVIALLSFLQFTVILDFMILAPLGAILMPTLSLTPSEFARVVSAYALSAGASGLLAAGFADRFDRKRFLLFFYVGFTVGTLLCGLAGSYSFLLFARIVTGIFGGVVGACSFAIATDLFPIETRGRVIGLMQTSFAAAQVMGIPFALFLSNHWGWQAPFLFIVILCSLASGVIVFGLKPVRGHLSQEQKHSAYQHLITTFVKPRNLKGFSATALLSVGGFMLMPFGSAYVVHNLMVPFDQLPWVYLATGLTTLATGLWVGKLVDRVGPFRVFVLGTSMTMLMVVIYTHLPPIPLWVLMINNILLFLGINSRMISSQALLSVIPSPRERGAYMSIGSSIQQFSGGMASLLAGAIVIELPEGKLLHYSWLGFVVMVSMALSVFLISRIRKEIHLTA